MSRRQGLVVGGVAVGVAAGIIAAIRHGHRTMGREVPGGILMRDARSYDSLTHRWLLRGFYEGIARDIAAAAPLSVQLTKRAINRTYEIMGMRQALLAALDTDALIEAGAGPERTEFNRIRKEQGLKAALEWRDARFRRQA